MKGKRVKLIRKSPVGVQRKHYAAKKDIAMEYDHRRLFGDFGGVYAALAVGNRILLNF